MDDFWGDVRFSLRLLARSPIFAITAVLLLGVGIGANTLLFSIVNALLLRPLPVNHPEELVRLIEVHPTGFTTYDFPYALYEQLAKAASLSQVFCQGDLDVDLEEGNEIERIRVNAVSSTFFGTLGIQAQLGRGLTPEDDRIGAADTVLSYAFWQRRFAGSASVVGRVMRLHGRAFTVVGVLPQRVNGMTVDTSPDVRVPLTAGRLLVGTGADMSIPFYVQIFGRLRPGVARERADAELDPLLSTAYEDALIRNFPDLARLPRKDVVDSRLRLESVGSGVSPLRAQFSRGLILLMAGVGLLLLMACANVGCLLLARAASRSQEIDIRLALGANPWRVAQQLLTESLVLAVFAGMLGVLLTYAGTPLLLAALPPIRDRAAVVQPLALHITVDLRVLAFSIAASLLTAFLSGLAPALQSAHEDLATSLRASRTATSNPTGRNFLVVAQIALCTLLLGSAGLLVQTFDRMRSMNPGFDRDHIVTFTIDPGLKGYKPERARLMSRQLLEKARSLPQVVAAAIASRGLMRGTGFKFTFAPAGAPVTRNDFLNTSVNSVTPGYFEAMGMRIVAGRDFTWSEDNRRPQKVIVNQVFASRFFPGRNALGKLFGTKTPDGVAGADNEIIGVASDAKYRSLREEVPPTVYKAAVNGFDSTFVLNLRTKRQPASLIAPVREVLRSVDPELPFIEVKTMREEVDVSLWQERLLAELSIVFSCFAAVLASIGLYGALDLAVKSRTREVGIRVALGADTLRVVRLFFAHLLSLVATGTGLGMAIYAESARRMSRVLYDIVPSDPVAIGSALLFIVVIAFLSTFSPIMRAVRIDPASALRHE